MKPLHPIVKLVFSTIFLFGLGLFGYYVGYPLVTGMFWEKETSDPQKMMDREEIFGYGAEEEEEKDNSDNDNSDPTPIPSPDVGNQQIKVPFSSISGYQATPLELSRPTSVYIFSRPEHLSPELNNMVDLQKEKVVFILLNDPQFKGKKVELTQIQKVSSQRYIFVVSILPGQGSEPAYTYVKISNQMIASKFQYKLVTEQGYQIKPKQ